MNTLMVINFNILNFGQLFLTIFWQKKYSGKIALFIGHVEIRYYMTGKCWVTLTNDSHIGWTGDGI